MDYREFNALDRGCRGIPKTKIPVPLIGTGRDAFAIHGWSGAQVALLQSPILPTVNPPYTQKGNVPVLPVDKTHTCPSVVKKNLQKSHFFVSRKQNSFRPSVIMGVAMNKF